jgi:hypothetical protein
MGIDIKYFRQDENNYPDQIKEVQRKRFKPQSEIDRVDLITQLDKEWREMDFKINQINKQINAN